MLNQNPKLTNPSNVQKLQEHEEKELTGHEEEIEDSAQIDSQASEPELEDYNADDVTLMSSNDSDNDNMFA